MKRLLTLIIMSVIILILIAFTDGVKQKGVFSLINTKTNIMQHDTLVPVKIQLEKTAFNDMQVLFINDTAATTAAISDKSGKAYGELMQFIQENKLQPQKFMAWYYAMQPPWPMDIAVETNSIPAQMSGRIQSKTQPGGNVIIAHMWGPYNQVGQAYHKIESWLKETKYKAKGKPFEVYLNDPSTVKSPFEIQTDIYQPIE